VPTTVVGFETSAGCPAVGTPVAQDVDEGMLTMPPPSAAGVAEPPSSPLAPPELELDPPELVPPLDEPDEVPPEELPPDEPVPDEPFDAPTAPPSSLPPPLDAECGADEQPWVTRRAAPSARPMDWRDAFTLGRREQEGGRTR
jgi:hypothetical protein